MVKLVIDWADIGKPTVRQNGYVVLCTKIRQFKSDVEGGLIILTLLLLISMLVVGGMAVDFMRLERERIALQSVSDRSVLAAANLTQGIAPADVIENFFEVEGYKGAITSNLDAANGVVATASGRNATVRSKVEIDTFYLRLVGMDKLSTNVSSTANAGSGNIEVSIVLDMSNSMNQVMDGEVFQTDASGDYVRYTQDEVDTGGLSPSLVGKIKTSTGSRSRMFFLRQAANKFVEDLLLPEYKDLVSINLIGYSDHVSLGDDLYKAINTTPDTIDENGVFSRSFNIVDDYALTAALNSSLDTALLKNPRGLSIAADVASPMSVHTPISSTNSYTNPSRCIMFDDADFNTLAFDVSREYEQVPYVHLSNSKGLADGFDPGYATCPPEPFQGIIAMSQDVDELQDAISQYEPLWNTSTHLGVKWGTALLDPSMRPVIDRISSIDPAFRGSRPSNYNDGITSKYIVIMTDGKTLPADVVSGEFYDTYEERAGTAGIRFQDWAGTDGRPTFDEMLRPQETPDQLNAKIISLCNLATQNITDVYTISMGLDSVTMKNCASKPGNAFKSSITNSAGENNLVDVFDRIAGQISALRLTD